MIVHLNGSFRMIQNFERNQNPIEFGDSDFEFKIDFTRLGEIFGNKECQIINFLLPNPKLLHRFHVAAKQIHRRDHKNGVAIAIKNFIAAA